jgi:GT2 family glycosyltransferase
MYTISRRGVEFEDMVNYNQTLDKTNSIYQNWKSIRNYLDKTIVEHTPPEKVLSGDDYSLINCCGDFQCAPKHIWEDIKGFEENLVYALYTDTNLQKKAVMHGYGLRALYDPYIFHINHGPGGGGFMSGYNRIANDPYDAIISQGKTKNRDDWGFNDIEIEHELY